VSKVKTLYRELIAENEIPGVTRCHKVSHAPGTRRINDSQTRNSFVHQWQLCNAWPSHCVIYLLVEKPPLHILLSSILCINSTFIWS